MKINKIHIYGFGKHENMEIDLQDQFSVIYGKNEAGKSTIMSFIKAILFGFPSKNAKEKRWEPRKSSAYGGRLYVSLDSGQELSIERVYKKQAAGDVRIFFDDGTVGTEKDLKMLLQGMHASVFQGVFHFGMNELQQLEGANGEDFTDYLLSASIIGNEKIFQLEKQLQKEVDELYKPQGKKPLLNELIKEWKSSEKSLQEINDLAASEVKLSREVAGKEKELASLLHNYEKVKKEIEVVKQEKELFPLYEEYVLAGEQVKQYEYASHLPQSTVQNWQMLKQKLDMLQMELKTLTIKGTDLEEKMKDTSYDKQLLLHANTITNLHKKFEDFRKEANSIRSLMDSLEIEKKNMIEKKAELERVVSPEQLDLIKVSFHEKNKIELLDTQLQKLEAKKEVLTSQEEALRDRSASINRLYQHVLEELATKSNSKKETAIVESYTKQQENQNEVNLKKQLVKERKQKVKQLSVGVVTLSILFLLLSSSFVFMRQYAVGGAFVFLFFIVAVFGTIYVRSLKKQSQFLQEQLSFTSENQIVTFQQYEEAKKRLLELEILQKQQAEYEMQIKNVELDNDHIIDKFEQWEQQYFSLIETREKTFPYCIDRNIYTFAPLSEIIKEIENYQSISKLYQEHVLLYENYSQFKKELYKELYDVMRILNCTEELDFTSLERLSKAVSIEKEKQVKHMVLLKQYQEVMEELTLKTISIEECKKEKQRLLSEAKVDSEEELYQIAEVWGKWKKAIDQKDFLEQKLRNYGVLFEEMKQKSLLELKTKWSYSEEQYIEKKDMIEKQKEQIAHAVGRAQELAQILSQEQLEEKYERIKNDFHTAFTSYMVSKIALYNIQQVIKEYKENLLPAMLDTIQIYFGLFTGGHYKQVYIQGSEIIVEDYENERFTPDEVSQATREQLYLAIRFALAEHLPFSESYPIIMDDPFVNFDSDRVSYVSKCLEKLGKDHQIIYFTCHEGMISQLGKKEEAVILT